MCGFVGFFEKNKSLNLVNEMLSVITHRGPDGSGCFFDNKSGLHLGHNRLAVQDLSDAGHQPMKSYSGRYVLAFNGEIYNHIQLRDELNISYNWNGHSDTETLLLGFEVWGVERTIKKCIGMFALSVWDNELEHLTLIRDRFGEKPLYYGRLKNSFIFASELKALKVHPDFVGVINRQALNHYFRLNYIPTPLSIYKDIYKLEPGVVTVFSSDGNLLKKYSFWSAEDNSLSKEVSKLSFKQATDRLEFLLKQSINQQMLSDVPLGAFLSGGIDSSSVVAILQSISSKPVKTFTIGFNQEEFNEANDAKAVAEYLGTDHKELIVSASDVLSVISQVSKIYDEPFADASQIPTFIVSKLAKENVTVCLSGDGGDELFCGYNRYHYTSKVWSYLQNIALFYRQYLSSALLVLSPSTWDKLTRFLYLNKHFPNLGNKIQKAAIALKAKNIEQLYTRVVSNWGEDEQLVEGTVFEKLPLLTDLMELSHINDLEKMMLWDMQSYLMDDVLVKTDRATMAASLEGRVPLLDHRIAEFAASLPINFKYRNGIGKSVLREVLYRYVPKKIIERPKKGFSLPIADWLRGPLRGWASKLLDSKLIDSQGFLKSSLIERKWDEHLSGKRDWSSQLWSVLMFQLWLEQNN